MTIEQAPPVGGLSELATADILKLEEWNGSLASALDARAHDIIQSRCHYQPQSPAVESWDGSWTYAELDEASNTVARQLIAHGISEGTYVPVCMAKSRWVVVAMLGIMKAGGAFVVLDPSHPPSRLGQICKTLDAALLVTSSPSLTAAMQSWTGKVALVDDSLASTAPHDEGHMDLPAVSPSSPVYATFTSGSTGQPKGVIISHSALVTNLSGALTGLQLGTHSRVLQFASYAFDISILDIVGTLFAGGCVCIPSEYERQNAIVEAIKHLRVNTLSLTPSVARLIPKDEVPTVSTVILAGEAVAPADIHPWPRRIAVIGGYGPAECTLLTTIQPDLRQCSSSTNIGTAPAAACWLVDPEDVTKLVPVGAEGELLIEGPLVGNGYIKNAKATAISFVDAPPWLQRFRRSSAGMVYRSGDLACYNPDGSLQYLGRKDTQMKVNGQRIEAGEIEHHVCLAISGLRDAIVDVVPFNNSPPRMTVFLYSECSAMDSRGICREGLFMPSDASHLEMGELVPYLQATLPAYMIPQYVFCITQLPLMKSGKLDRQLLRKSAACLSPEDIKKYNCLWKYSTIEMQGPDDMPLTPTEQKLGDLWAALLGVPPSQIGRHSSWPSLGGDSLLSMQLVAKAGDCGLHLTFQDILIRQTLVSMAEVATSSRHPEAETVPPFSLLEETSTGPQGVIDEILSLYAGTAQAMELEDIYPCTWIQKHWVLCSMMPSRNYTPRITATLPADVDDALFREAWDTVIQRSGQALRTHIVQLKSGELLQAVFKGADCLPLYSTFLGENSNTNLWGFRQPLVRAAKVGRQLEIWTHHVVYDGASLTLLFQLLARAYRGEQLVPQPYNRYVKLLSNIPSATRHFWKESFDGFHGKIFPELPSDEYVPWAVSTVVGDSMKLVQADHHNIGNKLRLAMALSISSFVGSHDVVFGEVASGRDAPVPGIEEIMGQTVTRVPTRVVLDTNSSLQVSAGLIQDQVAARRPHEFVARDLISTLSPQAAAACRFQSTLFIQPDHAAMLPNLFSEWELAYPMDTAPLSGSLYVIGKFSPEGVRIIARYDPWVISPKTVEDFVQRFVKTLRCILSKPDAIIGDVHCV